MEIAHTAAGANQGSPALNCSRPTLCDERAAAGSPDPPASPELLTPQNLVIGEYVYVDIYIYIYTRRGQNPKGF